jgi:hypothetical protein
MFRNWSMRFAGLVLVFTLAASAGAAVAAKLVAPGHHASAHKTAHCAAHHGRRRDRHCKASKRRSRRHQTRLPGVVNASKGSHITVAITSTPSNPSSSSTAQFGWSSGYSSATYECSIDGSAAAACPDPVTYTGLGSGLHNFSVRASNGKQSASASYSWTVQSPATTTTTTTPTTTTTTPTTTTTTPTTTTTTPTTTTTTPTTTTTTPTTTTANPYGASMPGIAAGGSIQNEDSTDLTTDLNIDQTAGAKWIRIDINWAQIQAGGPTSYDWTNIDNVVEGAEARGMSVLGILVYTPSWDRPTGSGANYGPTPASYAAFASAAVAHYSALGVHAYEIWNEENTVASWTPAPNPVAYTALLQAAYPAIKQADPTATVVTGGLAPATDDSSGDIAPVEFLGDVYADGGQGYFDAVGMHPYCWPANPGDADSWSAWYEIYGTSPSIRSLMVAHGDANKPVWATEFGAPTGGPSGSYVTDAQQASMISQAISLWSSYSWAGPIFVYQGRDQGSDTSSVYDFFGLSNYDGTPKPSFTAYQNAVANL